MGTSVIRPGKARITRGWRYWLAIRFIWLAACLIDGEIEIGKARPDEGRLAAGVGGRGQ